MSAIEVNSLQQLTREIETLFTETRRSWWFRGHSSQGWDLLPAVRRGYSRKQEKYLTNDFYVRARMRHPTSPDSEDYAGWLALMQHYGLPTRLLDWTRSALVATFFATAAHQRHSPPTPPVDVTIWALAPSILNARQGFEDVIYPLNAGSLRTLIRPALKGKDTTRKVAAAWPVESDLRMVMQQGGFTIHASDKPLNRMAGCREWLREFTIPADVAPGVARELDLLGVRLADLFPDLSNLAKELKGRYRPSVAATA